MADDRPGKYRNFPFHTLMDALRVATTIRDVNAGRPMNRLLLADALNIKPSSSNYRNLLSSSLKYGLTSGTEKAAEISLTEAGQAATSTDEATRSTALRTAACTPTVFGQFLADYDNAKVPAPEMLAKVLITNYDVPESLAMECANLLLDNSEAVGLTRSISGSLHVLLGSTDPILTETPSSDELDDTDESSTAASRNQVDREPDGTAEIESPLDADTSAPADDRAKPIFIGHGKNKGPLDKLKGVLDQFKIPYLVATAEPHLGRPIPVKVRETILSCGSAILIFTKDEKFTNAAGEEIWRPSENVVHELGAASFQYQDRVVIFKERGVDLPTNFSSVGYIEFEEGGIEAKTAELLGELIGFGLVKITPA
jgi:predicted nucleotide-binding protein